MNENVNEMEQIINELEDFIRTAERPKLMNKDMVLVRPEDIYAYLDEMRKVLPEDLRKAEDLMSRKDDIISNAVIEAQNYMENSRKQAQQLLAEQEIVVLAQQRGAEMLEDAKEKAAAIVNDAKEEAELVRADADRYAFHTIEHIEKVLRKGLDTVLQGKEELNVLPNTDN